MSPLHHLATGFEFLTAAFAVGIGVAAGRRRDRTGALPLVVMAAGAAGWAFCSGTSSIAADPSVTRVAGYAVFPFALVATVGWVLLAAAYTGRDWIADRPALAGLTGLVVLDVGLVATNGLHHRFATSATTLSPTGSLEVVPGPLYWVHAGVTLGLFLAGLGLLVAELRTARGVHQEQTRAVIGGGLIPMAMSAVDLFDLVAVPGLGIGVVGLTVGGLILLWALFYADFLDVTPVRRATLVEGMDEAVIAVDPGGRLVDLNRAAAARFEVPDEAVGDPFARALADYPEIVDAIEETEDGRTTVAVNDADRPRHYEVSVSPVAGGAGVGSGRNERRGLLARIVVLRDVTGRTERIRRLQQFRSVVEAAGDPILVLGPDDTVEIVNESMLEFLDRSRADVVGTPAAVVLPAHAARKIVDTLAAMRDGRRSSAVFEFEHDRNGGPTRSYEAHMELVTGMPVAGGETEPGVTAGSSEPDGAGGRSEPTGPDRTGEPAGAVCILRDVTAHEERKAELDLLTQILTRVLRHNIRNDLNVISGNAAVLGKRLDGDEAGMAATIEEKAQSVTDLADKANIAHRITAAESTTTVLDLQRAVEVAVAAVTDQHPGAAVSVDVPPCEVVAAESFEITVEHLVENAIVHNVGDDQSVEVAASTDDSWVELTVADDGPGIDTSEVAALHQSEETELSHASGLGLWIVTWIVEQSGGTLSFSTDATGTTVTIRVARPGGPARFDRGEAATRPGENLAGRSTE